jgi:hypothetical protein
VRYFEIPRFGRQQPPSGMELERENISFLPTGLLKRLQKYGSNSTDALTTKADQPLKKEEQEQS